MSYRELCNRLQPLYDKGEAQAIVQLVLETRFQLSLADALCGKVTELSANDRMDLEKIVCRLEAGEPVQYVLGETEFCGRYFHVERGVLIPRPETEELCRWILSSRNGLPEKPEILDVGTGSGCIAITLAAELPESCVTAWDISSEALNVARENAKRAHVHMSFEQQDVLGKDLLSDTRQWHLIVSNPPYICQKEAALMANHVLNYEPHTALFVPDNDALLFYRAIARYALTALLPGGWLYFEINPLYATDLTALLAGMEFDNIELRDDQFGKKRFVRATFRPSS